jgi:hypothetical protein
MEPHATDKGWRSVRLRKPIPPPDPEHFLAELAKAYSGQGYTKEDRASDFRRVFLASTEGKRVLYQIMGWSRLFGSTVVPGDPHMTYHREGSRDIGLRILSVLQSDDARKLADKAENEDPNG